MKKTIFFVLFILLAFSVFGATDAVVIGNNVRVRKGPELTAGVAGTRQIQDVVTVYEYAGSGEYKNGVWDKWAKIGENEWINAYWIAEFPVFLKCTFGEWVDYYYIDRLTEDRLSFIALAQNLYNAAWDREVTFDIKNTRLFVEDEFNHSISFLRNFSKYAKNNYLKGLDLTTTSDDEWRKTFNFDGFSVYKYFMPEYIRQITIESSEILLEYGIKVGMSDSDLVEILGVPERKNETLARYYFYDSMYLTETTINFTIQNHVITKIEYFCSI